jgi:hypothetical protein
LAALDDWVAEHNRVRPHQSSGMLPPAERFALRAVAPEVDLAEPSDDSDATVTRKVARNRVISASHQVFFVGRRAQLAVQAPSTSRTTYFTCGARVPVSEPSYEPAAGRCARSEHGETDGPDPSTINRNSFVDRQPEPHMPT